MIEAIKQVSEALDQQMELNFFMASQLIQLCPPSEQKRLKKDLHARLSALRERTLLATSAIEELVDKGTSIRSSIFSSVKKWLFGC